MFTFDIEHVIAVILALLQLMLITVLTTLEAKRKSPVVFMWATLLLMFGFMHCLTVVFDLIEFSKSVINQASVFVLLFCLCYFLVRFWLFYGITGRPLELTIDAIAHSSDGKVDLIVSMLVGVVIFGLGLYVSGVGGILNTSWSAGRDYNASLEYLNIHQLLSVASFALSGILLYCFCIGKKMEFLICFVILSLNVFITRNRILIMPLFVVFIAFLIFKMRKIKMAYFICAVLGSIAILYIVYGIRVFRHYGSIADALILFDWEYFIDRIHEFFLIGDGELGLRKWFYYFIEKNNEFEGFGECASYIRMLLVFVPTKWSFGLKPDDFAITMGAAIGMGPGGSMHPTLFGDCYANAGWFGILLGGFWACYATFFDEVMMSFHNKKYQVMIFSLLASMYAIMGRGSVYNAFVNVAWGIFLLVLLKKITAIKFSVSNVHIRDIY